ncbi:CbtA family protein [Pseudooceanicola algae]|uniref:Uncharacterized protein n=1 Tax=Pseudooceanicola algae TaxID=1537215 RepID=A0A418SKL5_9RHOB|nr:CbtA family protein [Pseudooceanicola algae]QPM91042.1 hypothetical protein PSAL_022850 [Pseudooceanicola algae]
MFSKIFTSALFAGFLAGLIAAALQLVFVEPVLLHAELYEGGTLVHFGAEAVSAHQDLGPFDMVRNGLSVLFMALVYVAYALALVAFMSIAQDRHGATIDGRHGILWGIAGFVTVHMAPAFGLPPELPGVAAADLLQRQIWWGCTVVATGAALWLVAFGKGPVAWGIAVLLLLAPQVIGAPEPDVFIGPVPPELGSHFASRALGVGLAAWVLTGLFAGHFWQRETASGAARAAA